MKKCFKLEFKRVITGRVFWAALLAGTLLLVMQILSENIKFAINPLRAFIGCNTYPATLYANWAGGHINVFLSAYLFIFPLITASAHAITYYTDLKTGYVKNIVIKASRRDYLLAKYFVSFISGGIVFVVPMVLNFMINAAMLPAIKPFLGTTYMNSGCFMASLAYQHPLVHFGIFMLIYFVYGGAFACIALAGSRLIKNVFLLSLFPFIVSYALNIISSAFFRGIDMIKNVSPVSMLNINMSKTTWTAIVGEAVILVVVCFLIYYWGGRKADVI